MSGQTTPGKRAPTLGKWPVSGAAQLTVYRVLMAWVYDRTESLLIATLMHASLIVSTVALVPPMTGVAFLTWFVILTAVLWVLVAVVVVANGGQLSTRPLVESHAKRGGQVP